MKVLWRLGALQCTVDLREIEKNIQSSCSRVFHHSSLCHYHRVPIFIYRAYCCMLTVYCITVYSMFVHVHKYTCTCTLWPVSCPWFSLYLYLQFSQPQVWGQVCWEAVLCFAWIHHPEKTWVRFICFPFCPTSHIYYIKYLFNSQ